MQLRWGRLYTALTKAQWFVQSIDWCAIVLAGNVTLVHQLESGDVLHIQIAHISPLSVSLSLFLPLSIPLSCNTVRMDYCLSEQTAAIHNKYNPLFDVIVLYHIMLVNMWLKQDTCIGYCLNENLSMTDTVLSCGLGWYQRQVVVVKADGAFQCSILQWDAQPFRSAGWIDRSTQLALTKVWKSDSAVGYCVGLKNLTM